jgi:catechol 2,3-dioxygenase-like lactoylglutathione lyase family enzyme
VGIQLNHLIIRARDKVASAEFLARILGLQAGPEWAIFMPVRMSDGVTLDFAESTEIYPQHYAFLVSEAEFDAALARIRGAGVEFYADFDGSGRSEINHPYGGRGVYFYDPNGHLLELITHPYGPIPEKWSETAARGHSDGR